MAMTTGSFAKHLDPGMRAVIKSTLEGRRTYYSRLYNIKKESTNFVDEFAAAGLPIAPRKFEADNITSIDALEGDSKRVTFEEWAIGVEVSQVAHEDDLFKGRGSALSNSGEDIGMSLAERVEVEAHRPFNAEGFDGTTFTVLPDDSGLFATSHVPVVGGEAAAQANRPSTDVDLSVTSSRDAEIAVMKYVNDRGIRIPGFTELVRLVIPPDLKHAAKEIHRSHFRPDVANQVDNVTMDVEIIPDPYITDTDQWIYQATRHMMNFYWRSRPRFDSFDDRRKRVAVMVGWQRFKVQPMHWLGVFGSTGA